MNVALTTVTPSVTGSPTSYSITGTLPAGLTFNTSTGAISGTPTQIAAESSVNVTASNSGGSTSTTLTVSVASSGGAEERVPTGTINSVLMLSNPTPASGEIVSVSIAKADATAVALTASGPGCGAIVNKSGSGSTLSESGAVASVGECNLSAAVTAPTGPSVYTASFTVQPAQLPAYVGGISFRGGTYFPSGNPAIYPTGSTVVISGVSVPQSFVNGGTGSIYVSASNAGSVTQAVVTLAGFPGYFLVPATLEGGRIRLDLSVGQSFLDDISASSAAAPLGTGLPAPRTALRARGAAGATRAGSRIYNKAGADLTALALAQATTSSTVGTTVQLVDTTGHATSTASSNLNFQAVNAGTIQFSLSWDQQTDVDLHVVTPTHGEIYYGRRSDGAGGSLDLDSNAACRIDGVNNENISWTDSQPPAAGRYVVRVDYWSNCSNSTPVKYQLRVTNCGVATTYTGVLNPGEADAGGSGSGRTIANIDYSACAGLSVKGKATFDDIAVMTSGIATTPHPLPIRNAVVEVRAVSGDALLGSGATDDTGNYSINFAMPTPGPYYVKVLAQDKNATPIQKVSNYAGTTIYSARSVEQNASTTPHAANVVVQAKQADGSAKAFNIYDVGVSNLKNVARWYPLATLQPLTWMWESSVPACAGTGGSASCYVGNGTIKINSPASDPDENDDSVISHEFGHFVIKSLSVDQSPGGAHTLNPLLAWSEGAATFWGQWGLNSQYYLDYHRDDRTGGSGAFIVGGVDLESPDETFAPPGMQNGMLSGEISEWWVAAVMFDLADAPADRSAAPPAGTAFVDGVAFPYGVFDTIGALKGKTHDRGVTGPDVVDFLDQWLCSRHSTWNAAGTNDFHGLVVGLDRLSYAPDAPTATPPIVKCT